MRTRETPRTVGECMRGDFVQVVLGGEPTTIHVDFFHCDGERVTVTIGRKRYSIPVTMEVVRAVRLMSPYSLRRREESKWSKHA